MRYISREFALLCKICSVVLIALGSLLILVVGIAEYIRITTHALPVWELSTVTLVTLLLTALPFVLGYTLWSRYGTSHVEVDALGVTFRVYEPSVVSSHLVRFAIEFFADPKAPQAVDIKNLIVENDMLPYIYHAMFMSLRYSGYNVDPSKWRTHRNLRNHRYGGKGSWFSIEPINNASTVDSVYILDYGMNKFDY